MYTARAQRGEDGSYTLSYGKGAKKITARLNTSGAGWEVTGEGACRAPMKREAMDMWGAWARMTYGGVKRLDRPDSVGITTRDHRRPRDFQIPAGIGLPAQGPRLKSSEAAARGTAELKRIAAVRQSAKAFEYYKSFTAYIAEVRRTRRLPAEQLDAAQTIEEWIAWAEAYAIRLDPFADSYDDDARNGGHQ